MTDSEPTTKHCPGKLQIVLWLGGIVLLLLLIAVGTVINWFYSDADLREVEEYAKSKGLSFEYADFVPAVTDRKGVLLLNDLEFEAENDLISFGSSDYVLHGDPALLRVPGFSGDEQIYPGMQVDARLRKYYHEIFDQKKLASVVKLAERMCAHQPIRIPAEDYNEDRIPYVTHYNELIIFMCEYALCAEGDAEFNRRFRLCAGVAGSMPEGWLINILVQTAMVNLVVSTGQIHVDQLDAASITALRQLRKAYLQQVRASYNYELSFLYHFAAHFREPEYNYGNTGDVFSKLIWQWSVRHYREQNLKRHIDFVCAARVNLETALIEAERYELLYDSMNKLQKETDLFSVRSSSVVTMLETLVRLDLLVAVAEGGEWPLDLYGRPLVPIKKDGKNIGAYSIGEDGIDDGWEKEDDDPIWLYDHLDP